MKIAIMQPYLFPYIGYFQLINLVDKFVLLDDVNFINRGWINRNRILVNDEEHIFTIPLKDVSQNKLISETFIVDDEKWKLKMLKTFEMAYKKAPYFKDIFPLISEIIMNKERNIAKYVNHSIIEINHYINIKTEIESSSHKYNNMHLKAEEKIIDICKTEVAGEYINPIGGTELYSVETFLKNNIKLNFLKTIEIKYQQFNNNFIPSLSIIDVLMFNPPKTIDGFLYSFELL
jgi:hypothetical protein